jgi:recombination protein RecA
MKDLINLKEELKIISNKLKLESDLILANEAQDGFKVIPTGSFTLDLYLGTGGYPCGNMTLIYGPESTGKSSLVYVAIREALKKEPDKYVLLLETEGTFQKEKLALLGVDLNRVIYYPPSNLQEVMNLIEAFIRNGRVSMIVLDSIASVPTESEAKGKAGEEGQMAEIARLTSKLNRRISPILRKSDVALIIVNQARHVMGYQNAYRYPGGNALGHWASIIIQLVRINSFDEKYIRDSLDEVIGFNIRARIEKNKYSSPKEVRFSYYINSGVDPYEEVLDVSRNEGLITLAGPYYKYGDSNIGRGRNEALDRLRSDTELFEELKNKLWEKRRRIVIEGSDFTGVEQSGNTSS